ncbi:hypothetical protein Acr_00g0074240 [Actinidia rufa]|uniref:Uncharacterized protein n=1 Tax=Actinidia rufa TaxID=165716 RepID=A0A7J0DSF3_9ERIC|nr:hypothetical protein Acr_00g0074240 [Actinidia rufa]
MLVRDSEALAQFRVNHRIPDDVVIERPGPNDDADWVEGEGNRMPIRPWFIYQTGLRFPLSKLLRTVLSICGLTFMQISVNFVRTVLVVEALMQIEGLEFTAEDLFHPNQPLTRLVTDSPDKDQYLNDFIWVSGQWEFPADEPDLFSIPRHRGYVPDSTDASRGGVINVQPRLALGVPFFHLSRSADQRLREEAEGKSSGSSESSSSSWDVNLGDEDLNEEAEVENGEEVDQVPTAVPLVPAPLVLIPEPINLLSSDSDIAIVESREIVEHSYSHSDSSSSGSQGNEEIMAPKVRILGKGQTLRIKPPMLPEAPNSSMPVPAEDQSIALSSMAGGKRKRKQPAKGTPRPKRGKGVRSATGTPELWAPQFAAVELNKQVTSVDTSKDHETCVALGNAVMLPQDVADHAAETTAEFGVKLVMLGAQLKQGAVDLKKENEKANNLEKELKQTKSELADARSCSIVPSSELERYMKGSSPSSAPMFFQEGWLAWNIHTAVAEDRTGIEGTFGGDRAGEVEGDRAIEAEGENLV